MCTQVSRLFEPDIIDNDMVKMIVLVGQAHTFTHEKKLQKCFKNVTEVIDDKIACSNVTPGELNESQQNLL